MKTSFNPNYNQNFGMALYMPKASKISKAIGKNFANEAEIARPQLQKLAEDVDLYVDIRKSNKLAYQGFDLCVTKVIKNPIKRFFSSPDCVDDFACRYEVANSKMSKLLVEKAEQLKAKFIKYTS